MLRADLTSRPSILFTFCVLSISFLPSPLATATPPSLAAAPPASPTRLYFARHGPRIDYEMDDWVTEAYNPWDPYLSEAGRRQAVKLGLYLNERGGVNRVLTSPLLRCAEYAHLVTQGLDDTFDIYPEEGLCQWLHPSLLPGVDTADSLWNGAKYLKVRCPTIVDDHPSLVSPIFAETLGAFRSRCGALMLSLGKLECGGAVLLVTHAAVIEACVQAALPGFKLPDLEMGDVVELVREAEGVGGDVGGWRVQSVCERGYQGRDFGVVENAILRDLEL